MGSGFVRRLLAQGHTVHVRNRSPASFTGGMARKDVRLMVQEAAGHGCPLAVMPAVAAQYDAAIARGERVLAPLFVARLDGRIL